MRAPNYECICSLSLNFSLAGVFGDGAPRVAICIGVPFRHRENKLLTSPFVTSGQLLANITVAMYNEIEDMND
jgi:hypothetical protein